jgi:hypothetical protein
MEVLRKVFHGGVLKIQICPNIKSFREVFHKGGTRKIEAFINPKVFREDEIRASRNAKIFLI